MNCRQATALMSQAQDRDLSLEERLSLRVHWVMCTGCRQYRVQLDVLRTAARRMARGERPADGGPPDDEGQERP